VKIKNIQVLNAGERTNTAGKPVSNIILLSLIDSDYDSLRPHLEYIELPDHLVLHEAGSRLEFAYFPNRGLISLVVAMKDGKTAEAGVVGNEGFTGIPAAVGLSRVHCKLSCRSAEMAFASRSGLSRKSWNLLRTFNCS
jgi:hypothetical protein